MTPFNKSTQGSEKTVNFEGDLAFNMGPREALYALACTSSLRPKFYVPEVANELKRLRALIKRVPAEFVAKLAVYVREKMYLRTMPLVLAVELCRVHKGDDLVRRTVRRVIKRADELAEILAYFAAAEDRISRDPRSKILNRLPKQLRLGLADAFNTFDAYQLAKYDRETAIRLRDVMFLVHPKPKDASQAEIFKRLAEQRLETPYTWETELSAKGNKKETWEGLIDSGKVGYMALLRNLRNILRAGVSKNHLKAVCDKISNSVEVAKSRQLPFRYFSAYVEISGSDQAVFEKAAVLLALEAATLASIVNVAISEERVVVACDFSGSMQHNVSEKSVIQNLDIGIVLGALLKSNRKTAVVGIFGDEWKVIDFPPGNILGNCLAMRRRIGEVGYSTNGHLAVEWAIANKIEADRFCIFTDCQLWDSTWDLPVRGLRISGYGAMNDAWNKYQALYPKARLTLFDLTGYGTTPISLRRRDVTLIAGWSDKVFDALAAIERGEEAVSEVEKMEI